MRFRFLPPATVARLGWRGTVSLGLAALMLAGPSLAAASAGPSSAAPRTGPSAAVPWDRVRSGLPGSETGFSVAVSGSVAVISAPGADEDSGVAYVYTHTAAGWHHEATIPAPAGTVDDEFAWAVAVSSTSEGTYVAIGGRNQKTSGRSFVYIYQNSGTKWRQVAAIGDPNRHSDGGDLFGSSLAITDSVLVIGAPWANSMSGISYIYEHEGPIWLLKATKPDPLDRMGDLFGQSVAAAGSNVVVNVYDAAYLYVHQAGRGWPKATVLHNPDAPKNLFGQTVALTGDMAMVGAPNSDSSGAPVYSSTGAVYVYKKTGTSWKLSQELTPPAAVRGNHFGDSIAVSGAGLLIGMPTYGSPNCGTAFLFGLSDGTWREQRQIADPGCTPGDKFGFSVAASGTAGVVGAPFAGHGSGAFYFRPLS